MTKELEKKFRVEQDLKHVEAVAKHMCMVQKTGTSTPGARKSTTID